MLTSSFVISDSGMRVTRSATRCSTGRLVSHIGRAAAGEGASHGRTGGPNEAHKLQPRPHPTAWLNPPRGETRKTPWFAPPPAIGWNETSGGRGGPSSARCTAPSVWESSAPSAERWLWPEPGPSQRTAFVSPPFCSPTVPPPVCRRRVLVLAFGMGAQDCPLALGVLQGATVSSDPRLPGETAVRHCDGSEASVAGPPATTSNLNSCLVRNAVWDGYNHWDYWYTDHHDAVPNTGSRFSSFRRVGSEVHNAQPPSEVDLLPFIEAVRKQWPGEEVGPWLGEVSIGTEIYDYSAGSVTFHKPFTVDAVVAREVGGDRVSS